MNIIDLPSELICEIMHWTSHLPRGLASTCSIARKVAESNRASFDPVEKEVLSTVSTLLDHSVAIQYVAVYRLAKLRAVCSVLHKKKWIHGACPSTYEECVEALNGKSLAESYLLDFLMAEVACDYDTVLSFGSSTKGRNMGMIYAKTTYFDCGIWEHMPHYGMVAQIFEKPMLYASEMITCLFMRRPDSHHNEKDCVHMLFSVQVTPFDVRFASGYYG
jgi:hypothetical protein